MIRRAAPRGAKSPAQWLLISQQEHARLSHELAAAWGNERVAPLLCSATDPAAPLAGVRAEFLRAVLHHDDGWADWWASPGIDPEHGRPYSFTEMPPDDAQRIWSASIDICRAIGPLAGWVVASHFSRLQSKVDEDYEQWRPWLARVDALRADWLREWLDASTQHTPILAENCLEWLQALDWMSLWFCCLCPSRDEPMEQAEPLIVGGVAPLVGVHFTPARETTGEPSKPIGSGWVDVDPWPFKAAELVLTAEAVSVSAERRWNSASDLRKQQSPCRLAWRLAPRVQG
ncbi:DUF3891 family protein [Botrimarina hoheduenensis]|uniref:DUF3891 family protein n=1 Tax=Botrimarina hoheduenensis TaxID=2528000 RepID=A0A5C5W990_9BACT|nr:DUF3891 family protein [Botrimarina hoheduenensis]TWT46571.1 hypothetical protein Pla111_16670 [Botrimarina hoheduenensis]